MNFFQLQNKLFYSKKDKAGELDAEERSRSGAARPQDRHRKE